MGSLTGFSIPFQFVGCRWHRSGHGPDGYQLNGLLRPFQMIHVKFCLDIGPPPYGTFCCAACLCDLAPNLELDTDVTVDHDDARC
jgi:hypothetical protein